MAAQCSACSTRALSLSHCVYCVRVLDKCICERVQMFDDIILSVIEVFVLSNYLRDTHHHDSPQMHAHGGPPYFDAIMYSARRYCANKLFHAHCIRISCPARSQAIVAFWQYRLLARTLYGRRFRATHHSTPYPGLHEGKRRERSYTPLSMRFAFKRIH